MESRWLWRFVLSVFLLSCLSLVSSLYFHIAEGEQLCFIEEIPADTVVVGDYRIQLFNEQKHEYLAVTQDVNMSVTARTPKDDMVIMSHKKGRFNFTSFTAGEHKICLQPNSSQPLSAGLVVVVHMDLRSGARTYNYMEIHTRDKLTWLQLSVRQLMDKVQQIHKELKYQKSIEENFRKINHNVNMWIYWWPIIRFVFVVAFIIAITDSC